MQDFNSFVGDNSQNNGGINDNLISLITSLATKYNNATETELLKAIYEEAKRGKERGTLTNADIENFVAMLTPMLDEKKRKILYKVADELKKI